MERASTFAAKMLLYRSKRIDFQFVDDHVQVRCEKPRIRLLDCCNGVADRLTIF